MTILLLGIVLWCGAHAFKRAAPGLRADLTERLGAGPAKGFFAVLIGLSLVLMILGFRAAPFTPLYTPASWAVHVNNLLMLGAVALFGMGHSKGRARAWLRHPMLTGVMVWAVAHLLVNGDYASLLLFGGLGLWAALEVVMINAKAGPWQRPAPGSLAGDLRLVVITLVIYAGIAGIHVWLGYWPFG
jgi:uncharacterized membrane protein